MSQKKRHVTLSNDAIGCRGEFNMKSTICRKLCCLNLRCIILQNQNLHTEVVEEFMLPTDMLLRIQ